VSEERICATSGYAQQVILLIVITESLHLALQKCSYVCKLLHVCARLRQKELQEERLQDALHEAEKPLARYSDDADLDARLREQEREGDTMLAYIRKKKEKGSTKSKSCHYFMITKEVKFQLHCFDSFGWVIG